MKFSTIVYYYLIVPSFFGGLFKLSAWALEKFQIASLGEWAFSAGFILSLMLFRPKSQWQTVSDSEFSYQVDFPGAPEKSVQDYDNGVRTQRLAFDLNNSAFVLQSIKMPEGLVPLADQVSVQAEVDNLKGQLVNTSAFANGSISGMCYCIAFVRNQTNYLLHLIIVNNGRFQYHLTIASQEKDQNDRKEYYKKFFDTFVAVRK